MTPDTRSESGGPPHEDPVSGLIRLFITDNQVWIIHNTDARSRRAAFRKCHGAAHGTFEVRDDLPENVRVGVFAGSSYPVWIRFSSDTSSGQGPDFGELSGVGIKLFDVGRGPDGPTTQDFLLQNIDRFFVRNVEELYEDTLDEPTFLKTHPITAEILNEMKRPIGSVLRVPYWSCLPSRFGASEYVKYKLVPHDDADRPPAEPASDYLGLDLAQRLSAKEWCFDFCLQFRTDPATMPLDDATVAWSEEASVPMPVATIRLPRQDINTRGQADYADNLAFSPWHGLPEHQPYGELQDARKVIYQRSVAVRRWANGVADEEPRAPRPSQPPY